MPALDSQDRQITDSELVDQDLPGHRIPEASTSHHPPKSDKIGLQLPQRLSFDQWMIIGHRLSAAATSSAWRLGDWVVYGQDTYSGRYRAAIERTSLDYQTLRNYAWVARGFPHRRRRADLSFGHHAEVAALPEPEQDFWLGTAARRNWSRNRLRREVRGSLQQRADTPDDEHGDRERTPPPLSLVLTQLQFDMCRRAANAVGLAFDDWALTALEQTARRQLTTRSV
jgi:hypothetical protein